MSPFDTHDQRSFVHVGEFDTDDRIKQELNTDGLHLPHTLPQPDPYYHHSHDPSSLHFPLSVLPPYPYLSTHTAEHYAMQHYQDPPPPPLPSPVVSHEYSHEYPSYGQKKRKEEKQENQNKMLKHVWDYARKDKKSSREKTN